MPFFVEKGMGATRSFFQSILYSDKALCFHHQTDLKGFFLAHISFVSAFTILPPPTYSPRIAFALYVCNFRCDSRLFPAPGTLSSSIPPFLQPSVPVRPHRPLLAEPPTQSANRYRTRSGGLCGWVVCRYTSTPRSLFRFFFQVSITAITYCSYVEL